MSAGQIWGGLALRWLKFNAVGAAGIVVQLALLALLAKGLGVNYLLATALAVEAAVIHNFFWHQRFTWADRASSGTRESLGRFLRFNLTNGGLSILGNLVLMRLLVGRFPHPVDGGEPDRHRRVLGGQLPGQPLVRFRPLELTNESSCAGREAKKDIVGIIGGGQEGSPDMHVRRILLAALLTAALALTAMAGPQASKNKSGYRSIEVTPFEVANGLDLPPDYLNTFMADLQEELTKLDWFSQILRRAKRRPRRICPR